MLGSAAGLLGPLRGRRARVGAGAPASRGGHRDLALIALQAGTPHQPKCNAIMCARKTPILFSDMAVTQVRHHVLTPCQHMITLSAIGQQ